MQLGLGLGLTRIGGGFSPAALFAKVTATPAFVYATVKMVSAYSGPSIRVFRPSDSAELDIGFAGARLDEPALFTFLGAQVGQIMRWYDQSGAGNHTASQATSARRATIGVDFRHNGSLTPYMSGGIYSLPSLTFDRRASSFYTAGRVRTGVNGIWRIGAAGSDPYFIVTNGTTNFVTALYPPLSRSVSEFVCGASSCIRAFNDVEKSVAALSAGTETGGDIGTLDSGFLYLGDGDAFVGYQSELSTQNRTFVKAALAYAYSVVITEAPRVLFVGDSITVGTGDTNFNGFNVRSVDLMSSSIHMYQHAGGGNQLQTYVSGYASSLSKSILAAFPASRRIVFLHMGTNDLTIGGRTAAQIYADIQSYVALVQADGAQCIVSTILPNNAWSAGQQTIRTDLNSLIVAGWSTFADGLCDFAADPVMGPQAAAANALLYGDGLHPTSLGHQNLASIAATAVNTLL